MGFWHSKHQSAICTADIDSSQCWRTEKCRSQRTYWVIGCKGLFFSGLWQHHNGQAETSINWLMILNRTLGFGLMGWFWCQPLVNAKDTRNVTYHDRIKMTQHCFRYGETKNLSKFLAVGSSRLRCRAYPYLNEDCQEKGKHIPRAVEG